MRTRIVVAVLAVLAVVACITINVYFPEEAVRDLSQQIEAEVQQQAGGEPATAEPPVTPTALPSGDGPVAFILSLGASTAWAQEGNVPPPEITNPAIRTIIASRAARLDDLDHWKSAGVLGETNRALVEVRDLSSVSGLKERAEVQRLVRDENADREQLFREIAAAKNVDLSQLERIRTTYAETMRANARPGDWIQRPDGEWERKK